MFVDLGQVRRVEEKLRKPRVLAVSMQTGAGPNRKQRRQEEAIWRSNQRHYETKTRKPSSRFAFWYGERAELTDFPRG